MLNKKKKDVAATPESEKLQLAIAEIAAESWRFERALNKALGKMDVMDAERFSRQYKYFADRVDRAVQAAGLSVLELTGSAYSVEMPVQAMNLEEFDEDEPLIIARTIEPVIMMNGRVVKTGMVMVDRISDGAEGE